jgi:hypothetical protein
MKTPSALRTLSLMVCGTVAALALSAPTFAQHGGGHGGGVAHGGGYGGGYHGGYGGGYRGGYGGGYRGGYGGGYHGGYGGYYGGYGWRGGYYGWGGGWYGPWAWGGVGLGLYFATLPLYYSTVWWEGVPYYYADNVYYRWDPAVSQYETVSPPPEIQGEAAASSPAASGTLIVYPKNGQTEEQQGKDKFECHRWAAGQTGFDPTQATGAAAPGKRSDYFRAQAACLEGRGYTVK